MLHRDMTTVDGIHSLIAWSLADAAARTALVLTNEDVGKLAQQADDNSFWFLSQVTPTIEWTPVITPAAAVPVADAINVADTAGNYSTVDPKNVENVLSYIGDALEALASGKLNVAGFDAAVQAVVAAYLVHGTNVTLDTITTPGSLIINATGGGTGAGISVGDVAPATPTNGTGWLNTTTGAFFIYVVEGGNGAWVEIVSGSTSNNASTSVSFGALTSVNEAVGAVAQKVLFATEDFDVQNTWDTVNSKFVAPISGVYCFNAALGYTAALPVSPQVTLFKNGVAAMHIGQPEAGVTRSTSVGFLSLAAGDYVELYINYNVTAGGFSVGSGSRFQGALVSPTVANASNYPPGYASFSARGNTTQGPLALTTNVKMLFNSEDYDPDNVFDLPNSNFVAPVTGVYEFILRANRNNAPGTTVDGQLSVGKNGAPFSAVITFNNTQSLATGVFSTNLVTGDTIQFMYLTNTAGISVTSVQLQGKLVRAL